MCVEKRKYTVNIHAYRTKQLLRRKEPCGHCPAARGFKRTKSASGLWQYAIHNEHPCAICRAFVGLKDIPGICPCNALGRGLAVKRAKEAVEEWEARK